MENPCMTVLLRGYLRRIRHKPPSRLCYCLSQFRGTHSNVKDNSINPEVGRQIQATSKNDISSPVKHQQKLRTGPSLASFIAANNSGEVPAFQSDMLSSNDPVPYLNERALSGKGRKVYFETYGCQMNVSDTEVAWSILQSHGFHKTTDAKQADVILLMTCAIRENAEQRIWNRLEHFGNMKKRRQKFQSSLKVGLLGCMAERLKKKIVERTKVVDLVAGPDAYRDLPRLLSEACSGQAAINVMLSMDETYADVVPVRLDQASKTAFVSIMRGCDNMCSYCIVPFTRGRERSRPITSIIEEVQALSDQGVKEVTLLGQNVNSYRDVSEEDYYGDATPPQTGETRLADGFNTIYRSKRGGLRFAHLLERVAGVNPEMRIRFTSPHPKDFPDEVLHAVKGHDNICNQIHLPAQSGNSDVLERMRRGYTREAYIQLVDRVRTILPGVSISSDFIAGFCGETESEHEDTLSLLRLIRYNYAYLFAYSMRQKTHAYHRMSDDVPQDVKNRRLQEMISVFREAVLEVNRAQVGQVQLVLIEGPSKKDSSHLAGRNDGGTKVILNEYQLNGQAGSASDRQNLNTGDYVAAEITDASSQVLKGRALFQTKLQKFSKDLNLWNNGECGTVAHQTAV